MDDEFVCEEDYRPLIPNGIYEAQCVSYNKGFVLGGKALKLFLHFIITEPGQYNGTPLFMAFNMPKNRKIKQGSKYYKTWCKVNGWQKPSRNAKMSPRLFKNKIYKIRTKAATPPYDGKNMPDTFKYSIVDSIVDVVTQPIP